MNVFLFKSFAYSYIKCIFQQEKWMHFLVDTHTLSFGFFGIEFTQLTPCSMSIIRTMLNTITFPFQRLVTQMEIPQEGNYSVFSLLSQFQSCYKSFYFPRFGHGNHGDVWSVSVLLMSLCVKVEICPHWHLFLSVETPDALQVGLI